MRLVLLSDTHNQHEELSIPEGDILIHAGDATRMGTMAELVRFNQWLKTLPHAIKIFVPGNHDGLFQSDMGLAKALLSQAEVLHDQSLTVQGLKIYGSAWQPEYRRMAFNLPRGAELAQKWARIPEDVDVLVTHTPPHKILDVAAQAYLREPLSGQLVARQGVRQRSVGCEELRKVVFRVHPRLHVFGHVHQGYGHYQEQGIRFHNVAICNQENRAVNAVTTVDL